MENSEGEWVSITEAAQRLSLAGDIVDRSSLSRYLKQHAEALPTRNEGKSNLVEFGALVAHRGENIRIRVAPSTTRPTASQRPGRFAGTQSDGAARKAQADASLKEMDLAVRRKELTPVQEVDQAGRDAIALMQSAFERAVETTALDLSLKYGWQERTVRVALKGFIRSGLDVFNREILRRLDAMQRAADSGEDAGAAGERASLQ